jgi:hypothetical protein
MKQSETDKQTEDNKQVGIHEALHTMEKRVGQGNLPAIFELKMNTNGGNA